MSDTVNELACAFAAACAAIDRELGKLTEAIATVEAETGAPADRQLGLASAVNEIAKNPDTLRIFANPEPWQAGATFGATLRARAAALATALRTADTAGALEALLALRKEIAACVSGHKYQPYPLERALARWEIRRACLPAHEEQERLTELDAAELAEAKVRSAPKHVRFELGGRGFDLPFPTEEMLKSRRWAAALHEIGGLFDFDLPVDSSPFRRELQRLREGIERVATSHPQVARVLRDYFGRCGVRAEAA
jgi:hypothetical protein